MFCKKNLNILYVKIKLLFFFVSIFDILNNFRDVYIMLYIGMFL